MVFNELLVALVTNYLKFSVLKFATQLTFTCSKSTIETIEKGVKYVQSQQ